MKDRYRLLEKICFGLKYGVLEYEKILYQQLLLKEIRQNKQEINKFIAKNLYNVHGVEYDVIENLIKNDEIKKLFYQFSPSIDEKRIFDIIENEKKFLIYIAMRSSLSKGVISKLLDKKNLEIAKQLIKMIYH